MQFTSLERSFCQSIPSAGCVWKFRISLYFKRDLERLVEFNEKAYNYNDSDPIILDNLGMLTILAGNLSKSEEMYKESMKLNPQFPEKPHYNYTVSFKKNLGRFNEGFGKYEKSR